MDVPVPCAVSGMLAGLSVRLGPAGELDAVSDTVPVKLFMLASVMVELAREPTGIVRLAGFAVRVKSGFWLLKNSAIGFAFLSLEVKPARFQFVSMVFVYE